MKVLKGLACALALSSCDRTPPEPLIDNSLTAYASVRDAIRLPDGRMLNFVCMGQGAPTVILTPGLGDFGGWAWSSVQAEMAKTTKVCAWDRPGFGLSDGSAVPQNVKTTTADLETALTTGKIAGPYVMVGHSLGSFESLMFADRHPDQVVGMVLVEPSVPDEASMEEGPASEADPATLRRKCAAQIRSGKLRPGSEDPDRCVAFPLVFPPALSEAMKAKVLGNPLQYESQASFDESVTQSSRFAVNPKRTYDKMPLIVLSADWSPPWFLHLLPAVKARLIADHARIDRGHQALASLSSRGVHQRVPDASHYLQKSEPRAVVDAVATVVAEARAVDRVGM